MDKFEEYRRLMTASLELAATTDGVAQKLAFLEIARLWRRLAEREARRDLAADSGEP